MVKKTDPIQAELPNIDQVVLDDGSDDVVDYTLRVVLAMAPGLTEAIRKSIQVRADVAVRQTFGGSRVYIGRRSGEGTMERNQRIRADFQRGERVALLERRYSLKKSQIWAILRS